MGVYVGLGNISCKEKPESRMIPQVKRNACDNWGKVALSVLADEVGNKGCAMVTGYLVDGMKAENCMGMQLFALDFDCGVSFEEIKVKCDYYELPISFAYHTLSSTKEKERFRVVFVHENLVEDTYIVKIVLDMLCRIFPEADSQCKNMDRLFFGGKELIYFDKDARVAFTQLIYPFYEALKKYGNLKRDVEKFCGKHKIYLYNHKAALGTKEQLEFLSQNDEIMDSVIIHKIMDTIKSSFFVLEYDKRKSITCKPQIKRKNLSEISPCQLLNDFSEGVDLNHNQKLAILTNLLQFNGGEKYFFNILEKYYEKASFDKWKRSIEGLTKFCPIRCKNEFCPYYDKCQQLGTIAATISDDRKIYRDEEKYVGLEEAYDNLEKNIEKAYRSNVVGLHLIKAQTALGKTRAYVKLIADNPNDKYIIAVPTNNLKRQIVRELKDTGVGTTEIFETVSARDNVFLSDEIQRKIAENHQKGFHYETNKEVAEYYETIRIDPNKSREAIECKRIIEGLRTLTKERIIVTTHSYFLQMKESFLKDYTIIIDEDILLLQIFSRINSVRESLLKDVLRKNIPILCKMAEKILNAEISKYIKISPIEGGLLTIKDVEKYKLHLEEDDNLNDLLKATAFVKLKDIITGETKIKYFCPVEFPALKFIVLSATLNYDIYEKYFTNKLQIIKYPEKNAKYQGNLIQYSYHSLGRGDLSNKTMVFDFAKKISGEENIDIITFKSFKNHVIGDSKGFHFGNTAGINDLKGRNIVIIGTPYNVEESYKLVACGLGGDVNQSADERPHRRRIKYDGCSFVITSYREELLREIQLYSIKSELEQCIGRARLLRFNCTVYLFSCFPCFQAELKTVNYLI